MKRFVIEHGEIRLQVLVLPTVVTVDRRYRAGKRRRDGKVVHAYFQATTSPSAKAQGTVVLPLDGDLYELVPHEVSHAVIHCLRGVSATDDESAATAIGLLSAQIFRGIQSK